METKAWIIAETATGKPAKWDGRLQIFWLKKVAIARMREFTKGIGSEYSVLRCDVSH